MSSEMTTSTAKFDRMTKEEKLRFCQELIKQTSNLAKSAETSGVFSSGSKSGIGSVRSASKSSKRPASPSDILSKRNKSAESLHEDGTKSHAKQTTKSTEKSKAVSSTRPFERSKSRAKTKATSIRTGIRSGSTTGARSNAKSVGADKSKSKPHDPSKTVSKSSVKNSTTSIGRQNSITSAKQTVVKSSTSKSGSKVNLETSTSNTDFASGAYSKATTASKSKVQSQKNSGTSASSKSQKKIDHTEKNKSSTRNMTTNKAFKSSSVSAKTKLTSMKSQRKSTEKHARTYMKDRTETCAVQYVPTFNSSSTNNPVPIYHLIRHAFGNMVREAICQLDKEKSGVGSQDIINHILKHYSFPNDISKSAIRNRTIFTINAGLRAGTLFASSSNKGVRIGRMRRAYPRMLC